MQFYCESLTEYKRLKTREVKIGDLLLGNYPSYPCANDDHYRYDGYHGYSRTNYPLY